MPALIASARPDGAPRVRAGRGAPNWSKISFMACFLGVPLAVFVVFELWPFVQAFYYALTDWGGFSSTFNFIGLGNFAKMLGDTTFLASLRNSALLAAVVPTVTLALAFAIAFVVTAGGPSTGRVQGLPGGGVYRVVSFFPYCIPAIVIGLIWAQVYDPRRGLLNGALTALGLDQFANFAWLGNIATAMPASMFVIVWGFVGFYTVLFVAAIKGIPAETYEAARIDGAGRFRLAFWITLPQMLNNVRTAYIYLGLAAMDAFVYMQALNASGGPDHSTLTLSQELYVTAFSKGQFGYATAMGIALALVSLVYAALVFAVLRLVQGPEDKPGVRP